MVYVNSAREPCRGAANPSQHWYESVDGSSLGAFVLAGEGVCPIALATARAAFGMNAEDFDTFAVGETRHYEARAQFASAIES
jgi:hypothetical protein